MFEYLLKSMACMAVFLLFYQFLLEKERMHHFKRFFLLGALVASLVIPALVFTEYVEAASQTHAPIKTSYESQEVLPVSEPATDMDVVNWTLILWTVYGIGVTVFGLRFTKHLYQIIQRIRKNPKLKLNTITQVLLREQLPPHTFFSYIFLNKEAMEKKEIPEAVLIHEETHAKQLHSLDVLFIELLQVLLWFNPLLLLYKRNIKLNHEFLADGAVIKTNVSTKSYQNTLLSFLSPESESRYQSVSFANAINYSSIKKRFTVMKKRTSKTSIAIRTFLILPMVMLLLLGFSQREVVYEGLTKTNSTVLNTIGKKQFLLLIDNSEIFLNDKKVDLDAFAKEVDHLTKDWEETDYTSIPVQVNFSRTPLAFLEEVEKEFRKTHFSKSNEGMKIFPGGLENKSTQKGASLEQMKEYDELTRSHNLFLDFGVAPRNSEMIRAKQLHNLMNEKQRNSVTILPNYDSLQESASREQMKEYNALAKKYNEMPRNNMHILGKEVERMNYIYGIMSDKQKANAEPFPDFPEPPSPPKAPNAISDHQYASNNIDSIITNQDPNDGPNINSLISLPPPPPAPMDPLDHIIDMAKKGATFYFEDKTISSDKAIELLKANKSLNIETKRTNSKNPQVRISKQPITIKK